MASDRVRIARGIISDLGGVAELARALSHKYPTTVQYWNDNGIPRWRLAEIGAVADRKGVKLPKVAA